jgi:hypothetical protein
MRAPLQVLFSGYAPVHFICFRPLYERLQARDDVEVFVSGGTRTKTEAGYRFDAQDMYRHFDLPADRVLSTQAISDMDFDLLFAAHTRLILPRRVGRRIQIFHGISYRNKAVRPENMDCDHYFLIGPYMHRRFIDAGYLRKDDPRAVPVGFMKTDRLLDGTLQRDRILAQLGFSGERPVLLYAPTGARGNSLETMGEAVIEHLLGAGRFDVIVKPHDHPKHTDTDWFARLARFDGAHCRIARDTDIVPLMFVADLLISDASSAANEFTLLDRPIVFLDTPELIAQAREAANSMLDLETWGRKAGMLVKEPAQIAAAVDFSLQHRSDRTDMRNAMARDFFYNPGNATNAAMAWLEDNMLGVREDRHEAVA